jgi:hypothetical protein
LFREQWTALLLALRIGHWCSIPSGQEIREKIMRTIAIVVACILTVSLAIPAYAGRAIIAAATCVPGDPAIQANRYFVTAGSVKHREAATGLITVYCPVPATIADGGGSFGDMFMTFTTVGDDASVIAQLLRIDHSGNFSPVVNSDGGTRVLLDSNRAVAGGHDLEGAFNHNFDFDNFYYYVRVDINRSNSNSTAIF